MRRLQTVPDTGDDAASVQSNGDGSNTDSGRGASDDGDIAVTSSGIVKNNHQEIRFIDKVPIIPIFQLSSFCEEFYGNLDDLNTLEHS